MTPTAFKMSQLAETKRANLAEEGERHRANTLNFVSDLVGSATGLTGSLFKGRFSGKKGRK